MVQVAGEVLAFCSQCKMDLIATVVAMKGDKIVRVHCKTCKKERAYKSPKGLNEPGQIPAKKATRGARTETGEKVDRSVGAEWRKAMSELSQYKANPYSAKGQMAVKDKLAHPTFGEGVVTRLIHPNKVEVLFEMDLKVLVCGGPRSTT